MPHALRRATEADVPALRRLVNAAYGPLGAMGLNFTGVDQDDAVTLRRMRGNEVYVMERDGTLIATVTFSVKRSDDGAPHGYVNQLAVDPGEQRRGIGSDLMDFVERRARELRVATVRLDTALPAEHLLRWYGARGYVKVDEAQWSGKTYRSAILEKRL